MTQNEINNLNENGFVELESGSSDNELIDIATKVGKIVPHPNGEMVFILTPKDENTAFKGTFSYDHGFGEFPLHTDTAFLKRPVRYLLLHMVDKSPCDTTIIPVKKVLENLSEYEMDVLKRAIYIVKTHKEQFYTSISFKEGSIEGFKYDPSCIFPFNKSAKEIEPKLKRIISEINLLDIKWTGNKTIILDNWKNLHGRKAVGNNYERKLKRIYINLL